MRTLIFILLVALGLSLPAVGFAVPSDEEFVDLNEKVEAIRTGKDREFNAVMRTIVAGYLEDQGYSPGAASSAAQAFRPNAQAIGQIIQQMESQLGGRLVTEAQFNQRLSVWITDACKSGGLIRQQLEDWIRGIVRDEMSKAPGGQGAPPVAVPVIVPEGGRSPRVVFGFNGGFLVKEQGYFLLETGMLTQMTENDGADWELVALMGGGRDFERDDAFNGVFGIRSAIGFAMVENFNFRLGLLGLYKLGGQGAAPAVDIVVTAGLELEFSRRFRFFVDLGPALSFRNDQSGIGFAVIGGPKLVLF